MVCGSLFGFTFGGYVTGIIIILKKIFNDLSTSLGLLLFCCAISSISGPVVVGAIFDKWNSYAIGYYSMGSCTLISAIILLLIPLVQKKNKSKDDDKERASVINIAFNVSPFE